MTPTIIAKGDSAGENGFRVIRWDGKLIRFPDVEIHGDVAYANDDFSKLEYSWSMLESPGNNLTCTPNTDTKSLWGATQTKLCEVTKPTELLAEVNMVDYTDPLTSAVYSVTSQVKRSCTTKTTTSLKSVLNSLGSTNKLANYKSDWTVFTPDLRGKYVLELAVGDKCQIQTTQVTLYAACNDSPNPVLDEEVKLVSLDGTDSQRVFVDASATTDREGDRLTYSWTLFYSERNTGNQVTARTYKKVDTGYYLSNVHGPVFSFIPNRQGSYIAEVSVDDGCSSAKVNCSINVNCQASRITADSVVHFRKLNFNYEPDLGERFGTSYMNAKLSDQCAQRYVEKQKSIKWEFIDHECIEPEVQATPAPTQAPEQCKKSLNYDWTLEEKPCTSKLSTVSIEDRKTNAPILHPDKPGTYQLRLTVNDLCSTDNQTVITVNAKCSSEMTVVASAKNKVALNDCQKSGEFSMVELEGSVRDDARGRSSSGYPLPLHEGACQAPPRTPSPTSSPTFSAAGCCPACSDCPRCAACQGCTQNCNCGSTRGWQYECQPVTRTKTVLRRVSTLMEQNCKPGSECVTTEVGSDYCPERCITSPTCSCVWQAVMKNETVDVEETECDWARVPIQGIFNSYTAKRQTYERPTFKRMSSSVHKRASPESPVSAAFISVISTLAVMLIASVIVNIVYWRKIRALGASMETASNLSVNSNESQ